MKSFVEDGTVPEIVGFPFERWADDIGLFDDNLNVPKGYPTDHVIWLTKGRDASQVAKAAASQPYQHLIQPNGLGYKTEIKISALMIQDPDKFFIAPAESILHPGSPVPGITKIQKVKLRRSADKARLVEELAKFIRTIDPRKSLVNNVTTAADEMITNVFFNAAFGGKKSVSRKLAVDFKQSERGEFFVGVSGERCVIGTSDPFGTLNPLDLLKRLQGTFTKGIEDSIRQGTGGAGIGFRMIWDMAASIYIGVKPGSQTIVAAVFPIGKSPREYNLDAKNFHFAFKRS